MGNTDDIREAPSLTIIRELLDLGVNIAVFDPEAMPNVKKVFGEQITYGDDQYQILDNKDALLILTEWSVFRTPNFQLMREKEAYRQYVSHAREID